MPEESVMRAALVLFVAAFGLPSLTAADVLVPVDSVQEFVNIRAEPDVDSDVIGRLYQGDSMPLMSKPMIRLKCSCPKQRPTRTGMVTKFAPIPIPNRRA